MYYIKTFQYNSNGSVECVYGATNEPCVVRIIKPYSKYIDKSLSLILSSAQFEYNFNDSLFSIFNL